ncbi:hypothetical protein CBER1_07120 [Cercospora berteroae]|uniref:Uncharacterized protein n=1 Tax=Cercospora berteroae TaxID=357750 RepID=A0A2S6C3R4_9PEZI|nr:hypothetical protein CBER1_07120 [Cercospora berteroae]
MSLNPNSKKGKSEWPTLAEAKAKQEVSKLDEPFEKIDAPTMPGDKPSKIKDKDLREGYTMIDKKGLPKPQELERNGKPFAGAIGSVAAAKDSPGKAADEMVEGFVNVPGDTVEVDEHGKLTKRT